MDKTQRCPICNSPLQVIGSAYESPKDSTDVFSIIQLGCMNDSEPSNNHKPCPNYVGGVNPDPLLITHVKNKVN